MIPGETIVTSSNNLIKKNIVKHTFELNFLSYWIILEANMWATIFLAKMLREESLLNGSIKVVFLTFL